MLRGTTHLWLFGVFLCAASANAELVSYRFTGTLDIDDYVSDPVRWPGIELGSRLEGTITIDTNPPVSGPGDGGSVLYDRPLSNEGPAASVRVGQSEFAFAPGSRQFGFVRNGIDEDMVVLSVAHGFSVGNQPGGESVGFTFRDLDSEALFDNSFPMLLDFGKFEHAEFRISRTVDQAPLPAFLSELSLRGTIDSFAVIPEPDTALLAIAALMFFASTALLRQRRQFAS